jgi:hypothetical protein
MVRRAGKVAQEEEHLPSKLEALRSNPRTTQKKKKKQPKAKYLRQNIFIPLILIFIKLNTTSPNHIK